MNPNSFKATYQGDEGRFILDDGYREGPPPTSILYTLEEACPVPLSPQKRGTILNHALQPLGNPARNITIEPGAKRVSDNLCS